MHEQSTPLSEAQRTTGRRRPWPWMNGAERFWWYVAKDGPLPMRHPGLGPCWIWTGGLRAGGYGAFNVVRPDGRKTTTCAHRYSYEVSVRPIPDGLFLDHLCENPACVNPVHLEPVTNQENIRRGVRRRTGQTETHCAAGHEYTPENTLLSRTTRVCRACKNATQRKHKARLRAEYNEALKTNPDLPRPSTLRR